MPDAGFERILGVVNVDVFHRLGAGWVGVSRVERILARVIVRVICRSSPWSIHRSRVERILVGCTL
jgi:hypothetical protein